MQACLTGEQSRAVEEIAETLSAMFEDVGSKEVQTRSLISKSSRELEDAFAS